MFISPEPELSDLRGIHLMFTAYIYIYMDTLVINHSQIFMSTGNVDNYSTVVNEEHVLNVRFHF